MNDDIYNIDFLEHVNSIENSDSFLNFLKTLDTDDDNTIQTIENNNTYNNDNKSINTQSIKNKLHQIKNTDAISYNVFLSNDELSYIHQNINTFTDEELFFIYHGYLQSNTLQVKKNSYENIIILKKVYKSLNNENIEITFKSLLIASNILIKEGFMCCSTVNNRKRKNTDKCHRIRQIGSTSCKYHS